MARSDFTELSLYFYMHRIHDFELIDYVKQKKSSRKLNALIISLLKKHIAEERENLINGLLLSKEELGFLPVISDPRLLNRELIDSDEIKKSFLKIQSELDSLKGLFSS